MIIYEKANITRQEFEKDLNDILGGENPISVTAVGKFEKTFLDKEEHELTWYFN